MDLLSLPIVMVENIFSYLTYDEIAKNRLVSKSFNEICMRILNRGFIMIERRHAIALKNVKAQLPRRESERRYHPLARHCDILTSIETRISMLNMTYSKFIENGMCCFIPGKVIDEIKRVLIMVEMSKTPPRAHEVLQELRDISSMAIEHFDDKISPAFRKRLQERVATPAPRSGAGAIAVLAPVAMRQELLKLRRNSHLNTKLSLYVVSQYKIMYKRMTKYRRIALRQRKTFRNLTRRQKEQESAIADLKKRIEECDIKYSELTHKNQAVGGKAIAAPEGSEGTSASQPLRHFGSQIKLDLSVLPIGTAKRNPNKLLSNIKPRKSLIKLPSLSEESTDLPKQKDSQNCGPVACTSSQSPKMETQATIAKLRGITNEISMLTTEIEKKLKHPLSLSSEDFSEVDSKKQKLD